MSTTEIYGPASVVKLSAREVLDLHADLQRSLANPEPRLLRIMLEYALDDVKANPAWAASHVNPATSSADLDPWISSLGTDLFGATTYQVTAEMTDLAMALRETTPDLEEIRAEDLPAPSGFMWFDKPVPRPSVDDDGREPLLMHAASWAPIPAMQVRENTTGQTLTMPGVRIREWGYNNDPAVYPRPLHLIGQSALPVTHGIRTTLAEHWLMHMVWILMGMEIVTVNPEEPGRHGRKRASNLRYQEIRVIRLRRSARTEKPEVAHRQVDWSCCWLVRGHWRQAPHGGTFADGRSRTWVRAHIKGPDGLPLRTADVLYRLSR